MIKFKPGDRVAAVHFIDEVKKEYQLIGYGIYQGRKVPNDDIFLAGMNLRKAGGTRPCVLLDGSDFFIYDTECKIYHESVGKQYEQIYKRVDIPIDKIKQYREEQKYPHHYST